MREMVVLPMSSEVYAAANSEALSSQIKATLFAVPRTPIQPISSVGLPV